MKVYGLSESNREPREGGPKPNEDFYAIEGGEEHGAIVVVVMDGVPIDGFGELTGEPAAVNFVETELIAAPAGTRFILATDAMEAIGAGDREQRRVDDYTKILLSLNQEPAIAAQELLQLTRSAEAQKHSRSDDATFVVIDV